MKPIRIQKVKVKFPRGIQTVHIPFMALMGAYDQLYEQINRIDWPKRTRRVEASLVVSIDPRDGQTSYELAQVSVMK